MIDISAGGLKQNRAKVRVAFVNTHPIQYFAPLYAMLNREKDLDVTALYLSDFSVRGGVDRVFQRSIKWDIDLLSGYEARFVPGASGRAERHGFLSVIAPGIWGEIRNGRFDLVVVHGHTPAAMLLAVAAARRFGIPIFMRGETHLGLRRSGLKNMLRYSVMRRFYRGFSGFLAIGSANKAFYRAMDVPEEKIFLMPYTVDNARFTTKLSAAERSKQRSAFGITDDRPIICYCAKLQRRKRPDDLVRAASELERRGLSFHLLMIGSGEMETELRDLARDLGLKAVSFAGFENQSALPRIYASCDLFVLPSENEPWGLAVNEAMCAGLPIVASREIGCVPDLVHDGVNGRTFRAGDVAELTDALQSVVHDAGKRREMGHASQAIISHWSYTECLRGLREAIASLCLNKLQWLE